MAGSEARAAEAQGTGRLPVGAGEQGWVIWLVGEWLRWALSSPPLWAL